MISNTSDRQTSKQRKQTNKPANTNDKQIQITQTNEQQKQKTKTGKKIRNDKTDNQKKSKTKKRGK